MSKKVKETRTRKEVAKAIESYRDKEGLPYYFIIEGLHAPAKAYSGIDWPIKACLTSYYVGLLRRDKSVVINYNGIPEMALLCDHLRQACENNDIHYQEKMPGSRSDVQYRIGKLRNAGRTLSEIAKRLED